MIQTTSRIKKKAFSTVAAVLLGAASVFGLQSCGGGGSSTPPPIVDQDASGLYKSGTGTLAGTSVSDIIAFVHDNRLMAFSVTAKVLIDGALTITSDDYTATVTVYKDGVVLESNVSVTGKVTNASSISGMLNGTTATGDFTVTFDPLYSRGATYSRVDTNAPSSPFIGNIMSSVAGSTTPNFEFDTASIYSLTSQITGPLVQCHSDGTFTIPDTSINIIKMDEAIRTIDPECTMSLTPNYTGFAAAVDGGSTDDTLLYAVTNGANAQFAILTKI